MNTQSGVEDTQIRYGFAAGIESCSTCALGRVSSGKMPGWYNCSHMKSYEYNSPRAQCFFTPSRYVAKKAAIDDEKAA